MTKFSIIIPIYNTEKYLEKCITSVLNQSYTDFEIILINDGSIDNSLKIINSFKKKDKRIKVINQENKGLSCSRNNGIEIAAGEYILFLDSDDYFNSDLLLKLNKSSNNNPDLIRFQVTKIEKNFKTKYKEKTFFNLSGEEAFNYLLNFYYTEPAWLYAYKTKFWKNNKFKFEEKKFHEDFGLIPKIILKSKIVNSIDYIGYNYRIRENSIMLTKNVEKNYKKCLDAIYHFDKLKVFIEKNNFNKKTKKNVMNFIASTMLWYGKSLDRKNQNKYIKLLKKRNIKKYLINNSSKSIIKFLICNISYKLYYMIRRFI